MFVIRQAKLDDLPTLLKLARMVHFINLPADKEIIAAKVVHSQQCFIRAGGGGAPDKAPRPARASPGGLADAAARGDQFMFVLENPEAGACLGTSQIMAHMGGPGNPNFSFRLTRREFFSRTLQTGTSHVVARLHADESGPTEIGGLILQPASRGHKLGRFLSFIRFHFIALHRTRFADRIIAEMMAPITLDGQNMLWEYLGRRFIPLSYTEADKHCQRSREFIAALLPKEDIYLSLLPPEARDVVGKVHEETVPARRMLETLGFRCRDTVDPFDGGPHLEADTNQVSLVRATFTAPLGDALAEGGRADARGFVSRLDADGEFRAVETGYSRDARGRIRVPPDAFAALGWKVGATVGVTPIDDRPRRGKPGARPARRPRKVGA